MNTQKPTLDDAIKIIKHYRKPINKENLSNLDSDASSILKSYYLENVKTTPQELKSLFKHEEKFKEVLINSIPKKIQIPEYNDGIDYSFQIDAINNLSHHLDSYYFFSDNNMVLMAKRKPQIYKYPSGKEIKYSLLTNEISANMSIYLPAMGNSMKKYEIVVRENSLNYLTAKAMSKKKKILMLSKVNQEKSIKNKLLGVMLSHEHAELSIPEEERINKKQIIIELIAEIKSVEFMKMNGFDPKNYEFFHKLREKRKYLDNFSGLIAKNNYDPKLAYVQVSAMFDK